MLKKFAVVGMVSLFAFLLITYDAYGSNQSPCKGLFIALATATNNLVRARILIQLIKHDCFTKEESVILAAPPRDAQKPITLRDNLVKLGISQEEAQELVNQVVQDVKLKKPGKEGEEVIRLITGNPSPSKQGKLATTWAKIKTKH